MSQKGVEADPQFSTEGSVREVLNPSSQKRSAQRRQCLCLQLHKLALHYIFVIFVNVVLHGKRFAQIPGSSLL